MEETKKDIELLTELASKAKFSAKDKAAVKPLLERYGVDIPTKTSCGSCWRDAAIAAVVKAKAGMPKDPTLPVLRGRAAAEGVYHCGRYVSNDTMTADTAEWMRTHNFPKSLLANPRILDERESYDNVEEVR